MSKRKGARKRRKKKARKLAPVASSLLPALAASLNACEKAGIKVRFRHGIAWSHYGVVLPPDGRSGWDARLFTPNPAAQGPDDPDDDLDT